MSQHDYSVANADGATVRADINSALQAAQSQNSGSSAPSTTYAYQFWGDTTNKILYQRNAANSAWVVVGRVDDSWVVQPPQGRLSLTSGNPVVTSDTSAAGTVYYTPFVGNKLPIYNGTGVVNHTFTELSLTLNNPNHASGSNYDVFAFNDSGALRIGTGPAWSSSTARGSGSGTTEVGQYQGGLLVNTVSITLRNGASTYSVSANQATLLGTIRCSATAVTDDSAAKRFVANAYNQVEKPMKAVDATNSWSYSTIAFRQANSNAANQLDFVQSIHSNDIYAKVVASATNDTGTSRYVFSGIGVDSTSSNSAILGVGAQCTNTMSGNSIAEYIGNPGIGRHFLAWLEYGAGTDTQTWYGDNGSAGVFQAGIIGNVFV